MSIEVGARPIKAFTYDEDEDDYREASIEIGAQPTKAYTCDPSNRHLPSKTVLSSIRNCIPTKKTLFVNQKLDLRKINKKQLKKE